MRDPAARDIAIDRVLPPPAVHVALAVATLLVVGLLAVRVAAAPAGEDRPGRPRNGEPVGAWTIRGGGWGHGVGMSQYGALGMALRERSADEIISFYYGGAEVGTADLPSSLRVGLLQGRTGGITLRAGRIPGTPAGARLRVTAIHQTTGGTVVRTFQQGQDLRVVPDGAGLSIIAGGRRVLGPAKPGTVLRFDHSRGTTPGGSVAPSRRLHGTTPPPSTVPPSTVPPPAADRAATEGAPVLLTLPQAGRTLRWGSVEVGAVRAGSATRLRAVATMGWTPYLRGLAEVPKSWPASAHRAQAIAARSYALATIRAAGQHRGAGSLTGCDCGVYADTRDQYYLGWAQEQGAGADRWAAAVAATKDQVVLWEGRTLVKAFYSSSNGGYTSGSEIWGGAPVPYYPAKPDPNDRAGGRNPLNDWTVQRSVATVDSALADLRVGEVTGIEAVTTDRSGRLKTVLVTGMDGSVLISGQTLQRRLKLRSTLLRSAVPPRFPEPPTTTPPTTAPPTTSPDDPDAPYDPGEPGSSVDGGVDDGPDGGPSGGSLPARGRRSRLQ